jgi:hypothetical protein
MKMQDMFWEDYFGMLTDKFGIKWMVSYSKNLLLLKKSCGTIPPALVIKSGSPISGR